ncbi:MAG: IS1182 family transposase [Candidatus Tectomicrobia bacterium]|nr:IS1182 family transposase [Candidatus Tectomicrobia bacterium]
MTWYSESIPPVPQTTAAMVRAAFPKGNPYVDLHTEFGAIYDDDHFADLYSQNCGRPVEVAPWRLALVTVMQYMEGLSDRQAADAVRRCMDWKYALSLELSDPGFNFTLLHDFRERLVRHESSQQLLDTLLGACKARGLIKARGKQRTDSTHVLAAIRTLNRLELALETVRAALNQLSEADPQWVRQWVPLEWYEHYGPRAESFRLPKETSKRDALAVQIGADGYALMDAIYSRDDAQHLRHLPDVEVLRCIWIQQYYRCTEPGREEVRRRGKDEQPPSALQLQSPYDLDARYCTKRDTEWVGYKTHMSDTCDEGYPDLITQALTTLSTTPDCVMGPTIQEDLAQRDLLPGTHLVDTGYVDAELLVTAQSLHHIDVVGPPLGSYSWQSQAGQGYGLEAFILDWDAEQARCPQGQLSVNWRLGHDVSGDPVIRIRFDGVTCRGCEMRALCTRAKGAPRQLTVRPQAQHEAIQAARQRQETDEFKAQYALRAGAESTISQGVRRFDLRRSRYIGLARTQLQQTINATAMNLVRLANWFRKGAVDPPKRCPGHFSRLAPAPMVGLAAGGSSPTG